MSLLTEQFIMKAILNPLENEKCSALHPGVSCNQKMIFQFMATCKSLYKLYLVVHLIPFLLFKRKKVIKRPFRELLNFLIGFFKSMLFAGGYTLIVRRVVCLLTQYYKYTHINGALGGFLGGITLNFQPVGRQSQIALFCLNKTFETVYNMGVRRKLPIRVPYGQCLIAAIGLSLICFHFKNCPEAIRENYLKILEKIIGNI